jgi:beta-galactosidase
VYQKNLSANNCDPTNLVPFPSHEHQAFNVLCLVVVRGMPCKEGIIKLKAESESLESATVTLQVIKRLKE